jgi:hypothetical protein
MNSDVTTAPPVCESIEPATLQTPRKVISDEIEIWEIDLITG